jgi:hypothetical protein
MSLSSISMPNVNLSPVNSLENRSNYNTSDNTKIFPLDEEDDEFIVIEKTKLSKVEHNVEYGKNMFTDK